MIPPPPRSTLFPYTTLFRSEPLVQRAHGVQALGQDQRRAGLEPVHARANAEDRKSTRLNSSHTVISYAVFCLKKKKHNPLPHADDTSTQAREIPLALPHMLP